ncbi:MAG: cytochrome c [Rheinheimera sp.]|nr:cytochrome c [Rheinheimera sp.]
MKFIAILLLLCSAWMLKAEPVLTLVHSGQSKAWTLAQLKQQLAVQQVSLDDPSYNQHKSYRGFDFKQLLAIAGFPALNGDDTLVLTASDGYAPTLSAQLLARQQPMLVFAEAEQPDFSFTPLQQGKGMLSPAPFYLIWPGAGKAAEHYAWPYQLVKIELIRFADRYAQVIPLSTASAQVQQGFALFKQNCLKCHSINLQGGVLGPELNAPKNVTEYWQQHDLKAFIRNPESYRYQSKMPAFSHFSDADIDALLAYLTQMKQQKIQR